MASFKSAKLLAQDVHQEPNDVIRARILGQISSDEISFVGKIYCDFDTKLPAAIRWPFLADDCIETRVYIPSMQVTAVEQTGIGMTVRFTGKHKMVDGSASREEDDETFYALEYGPNCREQGLINGILDPAGMKRAVERLNAAQVELIRRGGRIKLFNDCVYHTSTGVPFNSSNYGKQDAYTISEMPIVEMTRDDYRAEFQATQENMKKAEEFKYYGNKAMEVRFDCSSELDLMHINTDSEQIKARDVTNARVLINKGGHLLILTYGSQNGNAELVISEIQEPEGGKEETCAIFKDVQEYAKSVSKLPRDEKNNKMAEFIGAQFLEIADKARMRYYSFIGGLILAAGIAGYAAYRILKAGKRIIGQYRKHKIEAKEEQLRRIEEKRLKEAEKIKKQKEAKRKALEERERMVEEKRKKEEEFKKVVEGFRKELVPYVDKLKAAKSADELHKIHDGIGEVLDRINELDEKEWGGKIKNELDLLVRHLFSSYYGERERLTGMKRWYG